MIDNVLPGAIEPRRAGLLSASGDIRAGDTNPRPAFSSPGGWVLRRELIRGALRTNTVPTRTELEIGRSPEVPNVPRIREGFRNSSPVTSPPSAGSIPVAGYGCLARLCEKEEEMFQSI